MVRQQGVSSSSSIASILIWQLQCSQASCFWTISRPAIRKQAQVPSELCPRRFYSMIDLDTQGMLSAQTQQSTSCKHISRCFRKVSGKVSDDSNFLLLKVELSELRKYRSFAPSTDWMLTINPKPSGCCLYQSLHHDSRPVWHALRLSVSWNCTSVCKKLCGRHHRHVNHDEHSALCGSCPSVWDCNVSDTNCRCCRSCCITWRWMQKIQKAQIGPPLQSTPAQTAAPGLVATALLPTQKSLFGCSLHECKLWNAAISDGGVFSSCLPYVCHHARQIVFSGCGKDACTLVCWGYLRFELDNSTGECQLSQHFQTTQSAFGHEYESTGFLHIKVARRLQELLPIADMYSNTFLAPFCMQTACTRTQCKLASESMHDMLCIHAWGNSLSLAVIGSRRLLFQCSCSFSMKAYKGMAWHTWPDGDVWYGHYLVYFRPNVCAIGNHYV